MGFAAGIMVMAAVISASAQLNAISATCQSAATGLLVGPAAECLGVSGMLNVALTPSNQSIVGPIDSWLSLMCPQPACSSQTLDSVVSNLTSGCSSEFGTTAQSTAEIQQAVNKWYSPVREIGCLKDSSSGDAFCATKTGQALEQWSGLSLTVQSLKSGAFANAIYENSSNGNVPKDLTCAPCVQATYLLVRTKLSDSHRETWDQFLSNQCGAIFVVGPSPSTIKQSANASVQGTTHNGALSLPSISALGTVLLGVAGVFSIGL